ncbi:MAG: AAA family ATPase [Halodesulfurarchaeum sp.]
MAIHHLDRESTADLSTARMVIVCGLPGVGKTTVAARLADRLGGTHIRTDVVRKELFPDPAYSSEETRAVYAEVLSRAKKAIRAGDVAILDGTYKRHSRRVRAVRAASELDVPLAVVRVVADPDRVQDRIRRRTDDESDADVEIYEQFKEEWEPIRGEYITIDNSRDLDSLTRQLDSHVARASGPSPA